MGVNASIEGSNPSFSASRTERCPSGLRSATGNRVRAERCVAGSNPALSALSSISARFKKRRSQMSPNPYDNLPPAASFSLTSSDLKEGEKLAMPQVSGIFGAGGQDVSPQLSWSGFPSGTQSFVVTMCDPEAPTVTGFWHWAVVNIPGNVTELPAGAGDESGSGLPEGAFQLKNDARMACYVGAGPPEGHGRHRYIFAALALEAERVEIDKEATPALLMFNLFNGTLGRAFLEGWYER